MKVILAFHDAIDQINRSSRSHPRTLQGIFIDIDTYQINSIEF
jgi:hypothetical protein